MGRPQHERLRGDRFQPDRYRSDEKNIQRSPGRFRQRFQFRRWPRRRFCADYVGFLASLAHICLIRSHLLCATMATPTANGRQATNEVSTNSTRSWQVLKKRRWQLIAASVLLAIWIVFLVTMAA